MRASSGLFAAVLVVCGLGQTAAQAQTIAEKSTEIEALIAADDFGKAVAAARDLYGLVWDMTPSIGFTQTVLLAEPAKGFGIYNERPDASFKKGEPINIYVEPFGFRYGAPDIGLYSIGFFVDLKVVTSTGEVLAEIPNLTELNLTSRYQNREFHASLTYNLDGIAAGKYLLQTTIRDKNSSKTGSFDIDIEITE